MNLGDIDCRIRRGALQDILERCTWLLYHNQKHPTIASSTSWDEFLQKGASEILNLDITPKVLDMFRLDPEDLKAMEVRPGTWVHLVVLQVVGEQSLVDEHLGSALDFHRSVTDQAAAHLNLLAENTFRTPWLAAKILSKDPFEGPFRCSERSDLAYQAHCHDQAREQGLIREPCFRNRGPVAEPGRFP